MAPHELQKGGTAKLINQRVEWPLQYVIFFQLIPCSFSADFFYTHTLLLPCFFPLNVMSSLLISVVLFNCFDLANKLKYESRVEEYKFMCFDSSLEVNIIYN